MIAMKIRNAEPEYHIMRDSDANTAFSSLDITLPQATNGEMIKVNSASILSFFTVLFILITLISSVFQSGTSHRNPHPRNGSPRRSPSHVDQDDGC